MDNDATRLGAKPEGWDDSKTPSSSASNISQYQPLETESTFRLLRLNGRSEGKLAGSLHHFTLGSQTCPQYRALSYTWGKDEAVYELHMPHGRVIKIRENLRTALLALRDASSSCWLWIDAVCIDQESNLERNHQVRLMAEIYSNANVVVAWLQSAGEQANLSEAFEHVKLLAKAKQKVSWKSLPHSSWESLQQLCNLRYWTRKWIIQELVKARSVLLYYGSLKCSMTEFEQCCHNISELSAKKRLKRKLDEQITRSAAGRLASQRFKSRTAKSTTQYLCELVALYSNAECEQPCDHVYALYSLVGPHRTSLTIDYGASSVQRLATVLEFMCTVEQMLPVFVGRFVQLLMRHFRITSSQVFENRAITAKSVLPVAMNILGRPKMEPESDEALQARNAAEVLFPMPPLIPDRGPPALSSRAWRLKARKGLRDRSQYVGPSDMVYFRVENSSHYGLATCRLDKYSEVLHLPATNLAFVAQRPWGFNPTAIIGRAYCFNSGNSGPCVPSYKPWPDESPRSRDQVRMNMDLATLVELIDWANAEPDQKQRRDGMAMRLHSSL